MLFSVCAGLLYVDASRRANMGSSCSHSCDSNCTSAVVARNGKLVIALTTVSSVSLLSHNHPCAVSLCVSKTVLPRVHKLFTWSVGHIYIYNYIIFFTFLAEPLRSLWRRAHDGLLQHHHLRGRVEGRDLPLRQHRVPRLLPALRDSGRPAAGAEPELRAAVALRLPAARVFRAAPLRGGQCRARATR